MPKAFKSIESERMYKLFAKVPQKGEKKIKVFRKIGNGQVEYFHPESGREIDNGEMRNKYYTMYKQDLNQQQFLLGKCIFCLDKPKCSSIEECYHKFYTGAKEVGERTSFKLLEQGLYDPCFLDGWFWNMYPDKKEQVGRFQPVSEDWEIDFIDKCSGSLI